MALSTDVGTEDSSPTAAGVGCSSPTSPAVAVLEAIAEREDVDPPKLDRSVHDVIDTDAFEQRVPEDGIGWLRFDGPVPFVSGNHLVRLASDRTIPILEAGAADGRDTGVEGA